jgi:hypothetical protein
MGFAIAAAGLAAGLAAGVMIGTSAGHASGDAPWCVLSQLGEGAQAWDCQYETAEECARAVTAGGNCTPNPYAPNPAPNPTPAPAAAAAKDAVAVPSKPIVNTTSGAAERRKVKKDAK